MPSINNVRFDNIVADGGTNITNWLWYTTRCMKKAGWKFKASSNGTTKVSNSNPASDNWGAGSVTNAGASAASITALAGGRATVTGLTGIVAGDKGRFLLISGAATGANNNQHQIEEVISTTSVRIDARNFAVAVDANNGSLTWSILDPTTSAYPTGLTAPIAWWCAQGPSTLRIPFTSASSGTFIKGENITQATTGAEGEVLGYTFSSGVGYLNVSPRVRGTGGGVWGWATANLITGDSSGATVTQVGTAIEYVYEAVIIKPTSATPLAAQVLLGQFDTVAEATEMFSFCATQAGATATVHPGGGGTGNTFGTKAWVAWGSNTTAASVSLLGAATILGRGNVICVDAIPEQDYSADGSWSLVYSFGTTPDGYSILGFHRLEDIEDADFAPYVSVNPGGTKTLYSLTRTSAGTANSMTLSQGGLTSLQVGTSRVSLQGWRRRGLTSESFAEFEPCILYALQTANFAQSVNGLDVNRIATSPNTTNRLREPIWVISTGLGSKVFKGTFKWLYLFAGEIATTVFGTDPAWVQTGNLSPGMVIGPQSGNFWVLN